jgi:hypothetical protein
MGITVKRPNAVALRASVAVAACFLAFGESTRAALPDIVIWGPKTEPAIVYRTFSPNDCEIQEGCAVAGTRRLLSFNTEIRNISTIDLNMGRPETDPQGRFVWAPCHGHWHFNDFAHYRLLNSSGNVVVSGTKMAFCMEDTARWNDAAPATRKYTCGTTQGIQAGWSDIYDKGVPCQWLDITGVPGGNYTLEMTLDPRNLIAESNDGNNVTRVPITLPSDCQAPANDNFASAQTLSGFYANARGHNGCSTKENGEPNHAGDTGGHSIWYRWTAPNSGTATINTVGSDFDTLLAVYTGGAVNSLNLIAQNDDIVNQTITQSQLSFNAIANTTYHIAVDGWGGAIGGVVLNINPPTNDKFVDCRAITGAIGEVTGHNMGATKEQGEIAHAGNIGGHSVWYCWTAPTSGVCTFDTIASDFDTLLGIYTGSAVNSLTMVANDDNGGGNDKSRASFNAVAGTSYKIAVDGFAGANGTIGLRWTTVTSNDVRITLTVQRQLTVNAPRGTYQLQASTNLSAWSTINTFTIGSAPHQYTDADTTPQRRFYRVVMQPQP